MHPFSSRYSSSSAGMGRKFCRFGQNELRDLILRRGSDGRRPNESRSDLMFDRGET
jgi:hypothetical protein